MSESSSKKPYLDKVTAEFIEKISSMGGKPLYELTPAEARDFLTSVQKENYSELLAEFQDLKIPTEDAGDVNVRLVRPLGKYGKIPLIVYVHGGGWVMGDKDVYDMTIRHISIHSCSAVLFVEYSRSPEEKYPVAINQIYGVLKYFAENGDSYNVDGSRISLVGDSAGGNMAAAVSIRVQKEGRLNLLSQVLLYPVTDAGMKTPSYNEFENGPWLSKKAMNWFWDAYLNGNKLKDDTAVSLINAEVNDLKGLPQTLLITAENDVLRDEGEMFARKLIEAGVDVACVRINNTCHDFIMLNALRESLAVKLTFVMVCEFLQRTLNKV